MKKGITLPCARCGTPRYVYQHQLRDRKIGGKIAGTRIFCSRECAGFQKGQPKPKRAYTWPSGKQHPTWKRGWYKTVQGYIMLSIGGKSIKRCRYKMEQKLGRKLRSDEIVHHKNGDKTDDRIRNLEVTTRSAHCREHYPRQFHRTK